MLHTVCKDPAYGVSNDLPRLLNAAAGDRLMHEFTVCNAHMHEPLLCDRFGFFVEGDDRASVNI